MTDKEFEDAIWWFHRDWGATERNRVAPLIDLLKKMHKRIKALE